MAIDEERLLNMPRRQLQDLAKANKIRANQKSSEIIKSLLSIKGEIQGVDSASSKEDQDADDDVDGQNNPIQSESDGPDLKLSTENTAEQFQSNLSPAESPANLNDSAASPAQLDDPRSNQDDELDRAVGSVLENEAIDSSHAQKDGASDTDARDGVHESGGEVSELADNDTTETPRLERDQSVISEFNPTYSASISQNSPKEKIPLQNLVDASVASNVALEHSKPMSESEVTKPSADLHSVDSENVQDALDTYRKIAMQSSAELDAHGCDVPEPEQPSKSVAVSTGRKPPVVTSLKKSTGKPASGSTKVSKSKFDLQESLSRPVNWEMKKGPLPPVVQVLEDPNRLCLWSPSRMAERKKEFKNNDFGGTKRRLEGYMAEGRSKHNETIRDLRKPADVASNADQ